MPSRPRSPMLGTRNPGRAGRAARRGPSQLAQRIGPRAAGLGRDHAIGPHLQIAAAPQRDPHERRAAGGHRAGPAGL